MKQIGIEKLLLKPLYDKYRKSNEEVARLGIAVDTMEVLTKFISILCFAVLKDISPDSYYQKKILKNLKRDSYSLGNYYYAFQEFIKFESDNELIAKLKRILTDSSYSIDAELPYSIWRANEQRENSEKAEVVKLHTYITKNLNMRNTDNIFLYVVKLRNKKAHAPTINKENIEFIRRLFENIEIVLEKLRKIISQILTIEGLEFFTVENLEDDEYKQIIAKYQGIEYSLSPLIIYRDYIYFLIASENSKSEYQEYFKSDSFEINTKEEKWKDKSIQKSLKLLHYSDDEKYKRLKSVFVGREHELEQVESHIIDNYDKNTLTIITGKPGIGKSSFVTELQSRIVKQKDNFISYLFYAIKEQTREDEFRHFKEKVKKFLKESGVDVGKNQKHPNQFFGKVSESHKTFLLIVDGLDELSNVVRFLNDMKFSATLPNSRVHIILTTRPYKEIRDTIASIFSSTTNYKIYNHENVKKSGYSFELGVLKKEDTKNLIFQLLPKDDNLANRAYLKIIDIIVEKSGSLPIYIHYISREIKKEKLGSSYDYLAKLERLATRLPENIEEYYIDTFKKVKSLAREVLIAVYFSPNGISMSELYEIFREKYNTIDKQEFENDYFSSIELFLREEKKDYYLFYHLSVRDAILKHYIQNGDIVKFETEQYISNLTKGDKNLEMLFEDAGYKSELKHIFSFVFALNSNSDFNRTLQYIIEISVKKLKSKTLKHFIKRNFFYLYYHYCLFSIVTHNQDRVLENQIELSPQIKKETQEFFKTFEASGEKEDTQTIAYAYQLSKLIGNYAKTIEYYEMYNSANLQTFIRICSDINANGHIKEFNDKFEYWEQLDKSQQSILVDILVLNVNINEEFRGVYERLDKGYQKKLDLVLGEFDGKRY